MSKRAHMYLSVVLALFFIVACGDTPEAPIGDIPGVVRLWEVPGSTLSEPIEIAIPIEPVMEADYSSNLDGWHRVLDSIHPLSDDPDVMQSRIVGQGSSGVLELTGQRGGLYRIVPVRPNAFYRFEGRIRSEAIVPADSGLFHGATFFLGELSRGGNPEQVFEKGSEAVILRYHNMPSTQGTTGWRKHELTIRTGSDTKALLVTCVLNLSEAVASGKVFYDDLQLDELSEADYLKHLVREEASKYGAGIGFGDHCQRLVREKYGAETRPSLVALPGETISLETWIPSGEPRLTCGLGIWRAAADVEFGANPTLSIRIQGTEVVHRLLEPAGRLVDRRWLDIDVDLSRWAGQSVSIDLISNDAPGVFGAPMMRNVERRPHGLNLILVSIDTLRADHVGAYGAKGGNTPTLDALADSGVRVADVTSQAPYTLPSHVSMFSGQVPSVHGVQRPGHAISKVRTPMLADSLGRAGYITRAFTGGGYVNPIFGFDRGFDGYSNLDPFRDPSSEHSKSMIERRPNAFSREMFAENGPERIRSWLKGHASEQFFLFLHTYTVHDFDPAPGYINKSERIDPMPYMHHEYAQANGITPAVRNDIIAFYDAALRYVDFELGEVLNCLEALGIEERTVVVVTSDHGKELGERGLIIHGTTLYEELTRVPLIMRMPGTAPRVLERPAMLIDVAPTVMAALGQKPDPRMQGIDLLSNQLPSNRLIWSEVEELAHKYALRDSNGIKLIYGPQGEELLFPNQKEWELYKLAADPKELDDLAGLDAVESERMIALLRSYRATLQEVSLQGSEGEGGELDDETRQMLEQLGYF